MLRKATECYACYTVLSRPFACWPKVMSRTEKSVLARPCKARMRPVTRAKVLDKRITYPLVVSERRETQGVQYPMLQRVARRMALDG